MLELSEQLLHVLIWRAITHDDDCDLLIAMILVVEFFEECFYIFAGRVANHDDVTTFQSVLVLDTGVLRANGIYLHELVNSFRDEHKHQDDGQHDQVSTDVCSRIDVSVTYSSHKDDHEVNHIVELVILIGDLRPAHVGVGPDIVVLDLKHC